MLKAVPNSLLIVMEAGPRASSVLMYDEHFDVMAYYNIRAHPLILTRVKTLLLYQDLLYTPNVHAARRIAKPQAIPKLSHKTFSLLPFTSFQPTGTSATGMLADSANISISTSKIQPSECMYGIIYGNDGRENNLNPHCVSRIAAVAGGVKSRRKRWKECIRKFRRNERCILKHSLGCRSLEYLL